MLNENITSITAIVNTNCLIYNKQYVNVPDGILFCWATNDFPGALVAVAQLWVSFLPIAIPLGKRCLISTAFGAIGWCLMFTALTLKALRIFRVLNASLRGETKIAFTSPAAVTIQFTICAILEVSYDYICILVKPNTHDNLFWSFLRFWGTMSSINKSLKENWRLKNMWVF